MAAIVDPVTLEVIRNRLDAIAEEMQETMLKCAFSIILKEGADGSSAIFTPRGDVIAQSTSQPLHLGALMPAVRRILDRFPAEQMSEGDVFCLNDPYDGGTHLPDLILVIPGVVQGRVVVLGAVLAHHQDFGGMAPGSMTIDATEHFQEGLILGPLKLFSAGQPNDTLFSIIERNVRIPEQVIGDIYAEVAAGQTVARRTIELIEEFGLETFTAVTEALLTHAETLTRAEIAKIPDGEYVFEDCIDNPGGQPLTIRARVTLSGSDISMDFSGTSAQTRGPVNCSPSGVLAPAFWILRAITDPTISNNAGCYRPLSVEIPERSLLNPRRPAPVSIRAHTLRRVVDVLMGAFAQAVPERVSAASHGSMTCISYGGTDPVTQAPWVYMECTVGGTGATRGRDGVDVLDTDIENAGNIPAEALELEHPFRLWLNRLRPDSGGAGLHRGGLGVERVIEFLGDEAVVSHRSDRHASQPWGLAGGLPGATYKTLIVRADGRREVVPSRASAVLRHGDRVHIFTGGGGGYGSPLERPSAAVAVDVRNGKVSVEAARRDYGVITTPKGVVDEAATTAERQARLHLRLADHLFDRGELLGAAARYSPVLHPHR